MTPKKISQSTLLLTGLLLGLGSLNPLRAQNATTQEIQVQNNLGSLANSATMFRPFNLGSVGVKGSPLLLTGNAPGEVTLQSGRQLTNGRFNYDALDRQVTVQLSTRDSVRYQGATVKQLILRPSADYAPLVFEHFTDLITDEAAAKTELMRVVYRGTYTLAQLPIRKFLKTSGSPTYAGQAKLGDEYYDDSVYYLIRPDHTAEVVKLTRKSLVRALKEKGPSLESYVKTNNLDLASEADTIRALASLDQK